MDERNLIKKILGFCPQCGRYFRKVRTTRQNTAYVDDSLNFFTGCIECEEVNDELWAEKWAEYYRSVSGI